MFLGDIFILAVLIAKVNLTNSCVYLWSWPFACVLFVRARWSVLCVREREVKYSISRMDASVHKRDKVFVCI